MELKTGWQLQFSQQPRITEVFNLVKIEGTLDELRALLGSADSIVRSVSREVKEVKKAAKAVKRKLNSWQRYIANSRNHIKFKSGAKKGRLDLAKMAKAYKKGRK